jgi:hypothetical protein
MEEDWDDISPVACLSRPPSARRRTSLDGQAPPLAAPGRMSCEGGAPAAACRSARRRASLQAHVVANEAALEAAREAERRMEAEARARVEELRRQAEAEAQARLHEAEIQAAEVLRRMQQDALRARRLQRGLQNLHARRAVAQSATAPSAPGSWSGTATDEQGDSPDNDSDDDAAAAPAGLRA